MYLFLQRADDGDRKLNTFLKESDFRSAKVMVVGRQGWAIRFVREVLSIMLIVCSRPKDSSTNLESRKIIYQLSASNTK